MKLLAWDTSAKSGSIAALEWGSLSEQSLSTVRLVSELSLNVAATHSEQMLWGIHQVLQAARWSLEEVDLFGVGVGPGSFTGLRIGVTTARTLAHSFKKPLIPVSSLAALARPVAIQSAQVSSPNKTYVIAATDACKGELFALWGEAKAVQKSVIQRDSAPQLWSSRVQEQVLDPGRLSKLLLKKLQGTDHRWVAVGEGRERYPELWKSLPQKQRLDHGMIFSDQVQGRYLGLLAWEAFQAQVQPHPLKIYPQYLRASDAELKLKSGVLTRQPVSK